MIVFQEKKEVPFCAEEIFDLVMNIEKYPEFLPWITGARIIDKQENYILAELDVNFKGYRTSYTSRVSTKKIDSEFHIKIDSHNGPFKTLRNLYVISAIEQNKCLICFDNFIEFKFKIIENLAEPILFKYVQKIITAFEERANNILIK